MKTRTIVFALVATAVVLYVIALNLPSPRGCSRESFVTKTCPGGTRTDGPCLMEG